MNPAFLQQTQPLRSVAAAGPPHPRRHVQRIRGGGSRDLHPSSNTVHRANEPSVNRGLRACWLLWPIFFEVHLGPQTEMPISARCEQKQSELLKEIWRRRPDLNRGWRFCRPLPYHLATAPVGTLNLTAGGVRPRLAAGTTALDPKGADMTETNGGRVEKTSRMMDSAYPSAPSEAALFGRAARSARRGAGDPADQNWSGKRDSNPRLRPWQGRTLPLSYSRVPSCSGRPKPTHPKLLEYHTLAATGNRVRRRTRSDIP